MPMALCPLNHMMIKFSGSRVFDDYTTISDSAFSSSVLRIKALMVSPACLASMAILLETRVQKCR